MMESALVEVVRQAFAFGPVFVVILLVVAAPYAGVGYMIRQFAKTRQTTETVKATTEKVYRAVNDIDSGQTISRLVQGMHFDIMALTGEVGGLKTSMALLDGRFVTQERESSAKHKDMRAQLDALKRQAPQAKIDELTLLVREWLETSQHRYEEVRGDINGLKKSRGANG